MTIPEGDDQGYELCNFSERIEVQITYNPDILDPDEGQLLIKSNDSIPGYILPISGRAVEQ